MKIGQISLKILLLIAANDAFDTIAQLLMKRGLAHFSTSNSPDTIYVWLGVAVYVLTFFLWMIILREVNLSVALPVGSMSYIVVPMAAMFVLHEHLNCFRWIGIAAIVAGICFLAQSKTHKNEDHV